MSMMAMPSRVQLSRTEGWRLPLHTKSVARPGHFGNPFPSVEGYLAWLTQTVVGRRMLADARRELRGWNLACWCPLDQPCHADVLLRLVNGGDADA